MQKALDIKEEFYKNWVSPDGLALLDSNGNETSNGILFLAFFLALCDEQNAIGELDISRSFNAVKSIQVKEGLFARSPNNSAMEAHDNYIGICFISILFDFAFARQICVYGLEHGYSYNNQTEKQEVRTTRQGGDVAVYSIAAGFRPTAWDYVWALTGILIAAFKGTPSVVNLAWLRLKIMQLSFEKKLGLNNWMFLFYFPIRIIFDLVIYKRFGGIKGSFAQYYKPEHPINLLVNL